MKVEKMIEWVAGEVKTVPDTVWQLNDNFTVLAVEGVLNMLNNEGCLVRKLAWWLLRKLWKLHGLPKALRRLEAANATTISDANSWGLAFLNANGLLKWLFQLEASGNGDGATTGDVAEGEVSVAEETTEAKTLDNVEAVMEIEKTEVWGSGTLSLKASFVKILWPIRGLAHFMKWNEFVYEYPLWYWYLFYCTCSHELFGFPSKDEARQPMVG
jgi:hypothetical protein